MNQLIIFALLAATSVNGYDYFVHRPSTGFGLCATKGREYQKRDLFAIPNLNGEALPLEGETRWIQEWKVENLSVSKRDSDHLYLDYRSVVTDGLDEFKPVSDPHFQFFGLAANATVLLAGSRVWQGGNGVRVHLDQYDPGSEVVTSTAEFCQQLGTDEETCTELDPQEDDSAGEAILMEGRHWTKLKFNILDDSLSLERNDESIFTWDTAAFSDFRPSFMLVKTQQQPGVFRVALKTEVKPLKSERRHVLSRSLESGRRCLRITWHDSKGGDFGRYTLTDADGLEVLRGPLVAHANAQNPSTTWLSLDTGSASGHFRLDLLDLTRKIVHVGPCQDEMLIFGPASGCTVFDESLTQTKASSLLIAAEINANVTVELAQDQRRVVCAALGFWSDSKTEQVLFCSSLGCAAEHCPVR